MKTIFAILALCLVATNAAIVPQSPIVNYELQAENVINELANVAIQTAQELEHQIEEIVIDPIHQIDAAVQSIEDRREESDECVAAEDPHVAAVVDTMFDEMNVCGVVAAKTSAVIMKDVNDATQQLIFDGYEVVALNEKCKNYKNSILKNTCYTKLSIKGTLYLINARKSIKTITKSKNERVPAVFTDADACTHVASEKAVVELDNVHANIDNCVVRHNKH